MSCKKILVYSSKTQLAGEKLKRNAGSHLGCETLQATLSRVDLCFKITESDLILKRKNLGEVVNLSKTILEKQSDGRVEWI